MKERVNDQNCEKLFILRSIEQTSSKIKELTVQKWVNLNCQDHFVATIFFFLRNSQFEIFPDNIIKFYFNEKEIIRK